MVRTTKPKSALSLGDPPRVVNESRDEGELSEEEFSADSDYYGHARKKRKGPPAKKAKKGSVKQPSGGGSSQTKGLSKLPTMPLDVLFEVFSHLDPNDIINLSRTSRSFRDTLMTKGATSVWKAARERLGAPECPINMSEPQWAALLFEDFCQSCGAKNVTKIEFLLLRRVCATCKKVNYLIESKVQTRFPDIDEEVLELIPHTNVSASSSSYGAKNRYFWMSDITNMSHKLAEYEKNVHLHRPDAKQALKDFKAQQVEMVTSIGECKTEREKWYHGFDTRRGLEKYSVANQRFEAIKAKFRELGYADSDLECIPPWNPECRQRTQLTDRIWKRIRPILEPSVLGKKRERVAGEMRAARSARRAMIHTSYQEYQKKLTPPEWKYLPQTLDICAMDPFAKLLNAEPDVSVSVANFEDAFHQLPDLLLALSDSRKQHARNLLKASRSSNKTDSTAPTLGETSSPSSSPSQPDALDLATAAFSCRDCGSGCLFGWDDIAQHHCTPDLEAHYSFLDIWSPYRIDHSPTDPPKLAVSARGGEVAGVLVRAAGLDDKVATVWDMDSKDVRFGCSACRVRWNNGAVPWVKVGYKWRDFVRHCIREVHAPANAILLPPDDVEMVKKSEMADPNRSRALWTCAHCSVYFGDLKTREVVIEHLDFTHGIKTPCEPEDLFLFARNQHFEPSEATYPVEYPREPETAR